MREPPPDSAIGGGPGTGHTRAAAPKARAASTAIDSCGPPTAMSTPASAGATSALPLSIQLPTTLAAVSSTGARTTLGSSADCAGRGMVMPRLTSTARAKTTGAGASARMAPATAAIAKPCSR